MQSQGLIRDCGHHSDGSRKISETRCAVTGYRSIRWWVL
jgi:hypothetical protein